MKIHDWRGLNLQRLDIILCAGKYKMSKRIKTFQRLAGAPKEDARITHVAGIVRPLTAGSKLFLQESTTLNKWADKTGVQVNPFGEWLENYAGMVYVKQLDFVRTPDFLIEDDIFWNKHKYDQYENGIMGGLELLLCGMRLDRLVRKVFKDYQPLQTKNPHCSELEGKRLEHHSMWNQPVYTNRMPPWIWVSLIDEWLTVPVRDIKRIK